MPADRLIVLLSGEPVGVLTSSGDGRGTIEYLPDVVERSADLPLLSLSLRVRREPYSADETNPFLAGLLPEGAIRSALTPPGGWLRATSLVCWRSRAATVPAQSPSSPRTRSRPRKGRASAGLTRPSWNTCSTNCRSVPWATTPRRGYASASAGAQEKLVVVLGPDGKVGLPRGDTPSTHILKPGPSLPTRGGRPAFPDLVVNEAFCLTLARRCGIEAAVPALSRIGGEEVLVVERFDRRMEGGRVLRVHQEDVGQALGIDPQRKYRRTGDRPQST